MPYLAEIQLNIRYYGMGDFKMRVISSFNFRKSVATVL